MKPFFIFIFSCLFLVSSCSSPEENLAKANAFYTGKAGQAQDYEQALIYFKKAGDKGNAEAQNKVGRIYLKGQGTLINYVMAGDWFQKAAEQGNAEAQYNLGLLYYKGQGYTQNYTKAFEWIEKSAIQGNADAQFKLAILYEFGQGTDENFALSKEWLTKAIAQNQPEALSWNQIKYLKISSEGEILPPNATAWSCVKDNKTGLLWEAKQKSGIHNLTHKYIWNEAFTDKTSFVKRVNAEGLCGFTHWRGATIEELLTLVDTTQKGAQKPKINIEFFPYTINFYWSVTTNEMNEKSAWYINFVTGTESTIGKLTPTYVLLVHDNQVTAAGDASATAPATDVPVESPSP